MLNLILMSNQHLIERRFFTLDDISEFLGGGFSFRVEDVVGWGDEDLGILFYVERERGVSFIV